MENLIKLINRLVFCLTKRLASIFLACLVLLLLLLFRKFHQNSFSHVVCNFVVGDRSSHKFHGAVVARCLEMDSKVLVQVICVVKNLENISRMFCFLPICPPLNRSFCYLLIDVATCKCHSCMQVLSVSLPCVSSCLQVERSLILNSYSQINSVLHLSNILPHTAPI